ncbi:MAG: hypothetical protein ACT4N8_12920, partial [Sphingosinicella sp.]|uniref:hypothetical protein n=1 Tax=Sphingosinicella sp. TaxID=1917971 RepID=UPI00403838AE
NIERGGGLGEFRKFLGDLENAYLSVYLLPTQRELRHLERRLPFPLEYLGFDFVAMRHNEMAFADPSWIHPKDHLEITRITIQSPGWIELVGSLNPLQQIREYLKDRHERRKDREWRWETEKQRALAELEILRIQAERERVGAISEFNELLRRMDISPEQRQKILWERVGVPLARLGHHQDTGLLGSQNENIDGKPE